MSPSRAAFLALTVALAILAGGCRPQRSSAPAGNTAAQAPADGGNRQARQQERREERERERDARLGFRLAHRARRLF